MDCSPPGSPVQEILWARIWSGLPFPSPGNLPDPGIEPESLALQADSLPLLVKALSDRVVNNISQVGLWTLKELYILSQENVPVKYERCILYLSLLTTCQVLHFCELSLPVYSV